MFQSDLCYYTITIITQCTHQLWSVFYHIMGAINLLILRLSTIYKSRLPKIDITYFIWICINRGGPQSFRYTKCYSFIYWVWRPNPGPFTTKQVLYHGATLQVLVDSPSWFQTWNSLTSTLGSRITGVSYSVQGCAWLHNNFDRSKSLCLSY